MAKEIEKEIEQFGQKIPDEPVVEPEVKTPTVEEQLVALQGKLDTATKERDEYKTGLSTAHSKLTKADQEIKKQADLRAEIDDLKELQKMGFALMAEGKTPDEGVEPERKQELSKLFDSKVSELDQKRQMREYQGKIVSYQGRTEALGLTEDDPEYWDIQDAATSFKFQKAEALLKRIEKSKEVKPTDTKEEKAESEEERINKLVDEKLRLKMEEKGMLVSEAGGPSGAKPNDEEIRKNYRENPDNPKVRTAYHEYLERMGKSHR